MCIFNGPIDNVYNTQIFTSVVYPSKLVNKNVNGATRIFKVPVGKPLQIIIYCNNIQKYADNGIPTAMILPFPLIKGKNRVKILDMSNYTTFFQELDIIFPDAKQKFKSATNESDNLTVQYVGNYKASIVPNFDSFDKLKYDEFNLKPDVKELLHRFYSNGYGFMVCILNINKNAAQFHPFAYVHELRSDGRIFVPTRHYHKKTNPNPYSKYYNPMDKQDEITNDIYSTLMIDDDWLKLNSRRNDLQSYREKEELDWDHEIYVVNFSRIRKNPLLLKPGVRIINGDLSKLVNFYNYIESSRLPKEIVLKKPTELFKIKIEKPYKYNHDLYL